MGMQITIKASDMLAAGWTFAHTVEEERVVPCDWTGDPVYIPGDSWTMWSRASDGAQVRGYLSANFRADCRYGGHNEALFERLGLLALPHERW